MDIFSPLISATISVLSPRDLRLSISKLDLDYDLWILLKVNYFFLHYQDGSYIDCCTGWYPGVCVWSRMYSVSTVYTKSSEHINVEVDFTFQGSNIAAITVADLAIHVYDSFLTCNNSCMIMFFPSSATFIVSIF